MKAVVIREHGGIDTLRLEDIPTPRPGGGQMLVRVRAVALNNLDIWARSGPPGGRPVYPWGRPRLPLITGGDVAGVVEAVGSGVPGLAAGDRVVVNPILSCGQC
ncbi:MAG TPA: alcohol dehydrogenase catalytic domain-containing protein, partial [bacterium]|nr:alcohol dehydrogenase catalytic domain-containing protein [bacterium]